MILPADTVVQVEQLHKKFCRQLKRSLFYGAIDVTRDMLGLPYSSGRLRSAEFWALQDITFTLKRGEALGIVGQNGSGKTTLLRILNGIFPPDRGRAAVRGRIGALLAVGAGFHPHMTGRENIRLNGTILGMSRRTLAERMDAIVEFADIGDSLDAPVASYSSGMTVRLGFAIAIHATPEILLADEVLAVGDLRFALKCYRKIAEYRRNGGALILVSHSMQLIRNVCHQALWLHRGAVRQVGDTQAVCDAYEKDVLLQDGASTERAQGVRVNHDPSARITGVDFLDAGQRPSPVFAVGATLRIRIYYACDRRIARPIFTVGLTTVESITVVANYSNYDAPDALGALTGQGSVDFVIHSLAVKPGSYDCTVTLVEDTLENVLDWHERAYHFVVEAGSGRPMFGLYQPVVTWESDVGGVPC